jgi:polar amino acid transport system substrate-binding protein
LRQADKELLEAINAALGDFINTKDHLELVKRFGFSEQQLPGDKTTEEICAGT